jgi:plastocyanin
VDDILCGIDAPASDIDADTLTYTFEWTRNGLPFDAATTTAIAGDTIAAADVGSDEVWICTAAAHDGADSGGTVSAFTTSVHSETKVTYNSPGSYTVVIPEGISTLKVKAWGAGGGASQHGSPGGGGGFGQGTLAVSPGDAFVIVVGGGGGGSPGCGAGSAGGTPGNGGSGSNHCAHPGYGNGAGGGGYSGVFLSGVTHGNARILGGGGGGGSTVAGAGGGENGETVFTGYGTQGGGGTQSGGGAAGGGGGHTGGALTGANGITISHWGTGGGGGGYYGGGSGGFYCCGHGGGGGGGSGFVSGSDTELTQGSRDLVANSGDDDYLSPAGIGGTSSGEDGGNGLVVLVY